MRAIIQNSAVLLYPSIMETNRIQKSERSSASSDVELPQSKARSLSMLCSYAVRSNTEIVGAIEDFLFDDITWHIRYLRVTPEQSGEMLELPTVLVEEAAHEEPFSFLIRESSGEFLEQFEKSNTSGRSEYSLPTPGNRLHSFKEMLGYKVTAGNQPTSHLDDFIVGFPWWRMIHLVTKTDHWLSPRFSVCDLSRVKRIDKRHAEVLLDSSRDTYSSITQASN